MTAILRGGAEKVREAGAAIAGGHTIQDKEPKYGLVVLGLVDPRRVLTKSGAQPGDVLVLTKRLGAGVITTALKRDLATEEQVAVATASMLRLNRAASEAALAAGVRAATDVTGFGLLGHASEMLELPPSISPPGGGGPERMIGLRDQWLDSGFTLIDCRGCRARRSWAMRGCIRAERTIIDSTMADGSVLISD